MGAIAQPLARYAAWRRAGDLVLLSGVIAVDPAAGRIVRGYDDIREGDQLEAFEVKEVARTL